MDISSLLETLVYKRIGRVENRDANGYNHIACFFKNNGKKINILSIGMNRQTIPHNLPNVHAELDAISRLKDNKRKKLESVNLCVIRANTQGGLSNSKPCVHCLISLEMIAPKKGYKIEKIFYSTKEGTVEKSNMSELKNEDEIHVTRFFKERNFKIKSAEKKTN